MPAPRSDTLPNGLNSREPLLSCLSTEETVEGLKQAPAGILAVAVADAATAAWLAGSATAAASALAAAPDPATTVAAVAAAARTAAKKTHEALRYDGSLPFTAAGGQQRQNLYELHKAARKHSLCAIATTTTAAAACSSTRT